ncbi:MAG TPA: hypothetical protein DEH78_31655, partial [Solibacterales bacterium]|nr:hypothetical protein [Bryobacterales bacterium]
MPLWDAIRFHSHPLRGALHHYAGLSHSPGPERIRLKNFGTSIWIRPNTSDYSVYRQVFVDLEYGLLEKLENVNTILDCGANVG